MSLTPPDTDIHDLVRELTEPHDVPILDRGRRLGTRHQTALLVKLRNATTASVGTAATGTGTTASALHERSTLNSSAAELYTAIEKRIRQWALAAGYQPTGAWPEPERLLRTWYATRSALLNDTAYTATMHAWVRKISDLTIDPPQKFTLRDDLNRLRPCPRCGERWAVIDIGGEEARVPALHGTRRTLIDETDVYCHACKTLWQGRAGLHELAGLIAPPANHETQATA